jgi:hypothetical protein
MADFSFVTTYMFQMLGSATFWVILIAGGFFALIIGLKMHKNKRMKISVLKIVPIGNKKIGLIETKAGFFRKEKKLFGLWESGGEAELVTKQGEVIYGSTPEDYHDYNGKRTLIVTPNPDKPDELFPVQDFYMSKSAQQMLMDLPPLEIREAAIDGYNKATKEMKDFKEQIIQWIMIGMFFIVAFLTILFITQYGKHMVDTAHADNIGAQDTLKDIGQKFVDAVNAMHTGSTTTGAP